MSQSLLEDLEEGEIADDVVPEPLVQKKSKPLPRRYVINDKKLKSKRRKKSCKHPTEHHYKSNFHSHSKPHIKHHKTCSKHNFRGHSKFSITSNYDSEKFVANDSSHKEFHYSHSKVPMVKSAFKNYRSPPRKVVNDSSKLLPSQNKVANSSHPRQLSDYKKSPNGLNKLKNISNFNDIISIGNEKHLNKSSSEKKENLQSKLKCENPPLIEVINVTDDEDEEELRRIALATCLKRSTTIPDISSEDSSSKLNCSESDIPVVIDSDNYEVVDMEVDNESENPNKIGDLYVIDTTPTYFNELNNDPPSCVFDQHFNINQINANGFLPNIIIDNSFQNFNNNEVFSQNLNNDLYTNFEVDNSRLPPSQLDDEFEEELLRAELIANMKSMRKGSQSMPKNEDILNSDPSLVADDNFARVVTKETRTVKLKSDSFNNERVVDVARDDSVPGLGFKDERVVSLVKDMIVNEAPFNTNPRKVSSLKISHLSNANNSSVRQVPDIKVKLNNNAHSATGSTSNIVTLPQERIVISLNNETSSDESDQDNAIQAKQSEKNKNPAVASLEALVSNARQESDGKKSSNLNGVSDALSCLSKAQQEEYNSLIKILAKKKEPFMQLPQEVKKVTEDANLILLKKKINIAKDNFEKEKSLMNTMMKELAKKKRSYMLSKLKTQQLKEQLIASEKVRKANLQKWTKCSHELQTLKKSVNKRQALINSLQTKISTFCPESVSNGLSPLSNTLLEQEFMIR